jgi:hypothetical protein
MSDNSFTLCALHMRQHVSPPCEHLPTYITLSYYTIFDSFGDCCCLFYLSFLIQRKKTSYPFFSQTYHTLIARNGYHYYSFFLFTYFRTPFQHHSHHYLRARVNTRPPLGTIPLPYHTILSTSHSRDVLVYFYLSFLYQRKKK